MSEDIGSTAGAEGDNALPKSRVAFERLRERTDELELLVSGLLAFALLTVPDWMLDHWASGSIHVEGFLVSALRFLYMFGIGVSYTLAVAFIIHLAIRGYWIGLIGLKSTFPDGIRWDRLPMSGPVSRRYHRERVIDLSSAIDRADRAASILFAMTILIALTLAWAAVLIVCAMVVGAVAGQLLGDVDRIIMSILVVMYAVFLSATFFLLALDGVLLKRRPELERIAWLRKGTEILVRFTNFFIPQRLIMPVQMTLMSNLDRRKFMVFYVAVSFVAITTGAFVLSSANAFAPLNSYSVLNGLAVKHGMLSAHYENMRVDHDRLLRFPMIQADRIGEAHLRLFIPHRPQRDNDAARRHCRGLDGDGRNSGRAGEASALAASCMATLWAVSLDGAPVDLTDFVPIERRDLGMRGMIGYLSLVELAPGRHDLLLTWNPDGDGETSSQPIDYRIPFWFTPGIELGL